MAGALDRFHERTSGSFTSVEGSTPIFNFGSFADVSLIFPATYAATSISIRAYHGEDPNDSIAAGGDNAWKEVTTITPSADAVIKLPDVCFPISYLKFVTNNAGSDAQIVWMECKG